MNIIQQFFASKRNILNLFAVLIGIFQYATNTQYIDPKTGALIVFILNIVLGTFFPSEPVKKS